MCASTQAVEFSALVLEADVFRGQRCVKCVKNCVSGGCVSEKGFVIYTALSSWQKRGDRAINSECRSCSSYSASPFHPSHANTHIPKSLCECWRALRKGSHICVSGGSLLQLYTAAQPCAEKSDKCIIFIFNLTFYQCSV